MTIAPAPQSETTKTPFYKSNMAQAIGVSVLFIAAEGFIGSTQAAEPLTPVQASFEQTFTGPSKCLADAYQTAAIQPKNAKPGEVVTITPEQVSQDWPILSLIYNGESDNQDVAVFSFVVGDNQTQAVIDRECGTAIS